MTRPTNLATALREESAHRAKRANKAAIKRAAKLMEAATASGAISEIGLTGSSGFVGGGMHVAAPYDANGKVFAERPGRFDGWWRRVTPKQAKAWGWIVIRCAWCRRPAVRLDHHYPYMTGANACRRHLNKGFRDE